eukprot:TRINITY_DN2472_c0_g1_i1.p1 TRINITY_DN2472_c0_g1~~TRINITY_DN2472_c0_g1_i1.p1  ORF type:complete len:535 (+),score=89.86 TRINITY_DN2472_c0_g1_i1:162-1766(+)
MGAGQSLELLEKPVDPSALYWPQVPYEGPVKLRFCCSVCQNEAFTLDRFPKIWKDCTTLKGQCWQCDKSQNADTKFVEFGPQREVICTFRRKCDNPQALALQLKKILRSPTVADLQSKDVVFTLTHRPNNIRYSKDPEAQTPQLPSDFLWPDSVATLSLEEKLNKFHEVIQKHVKTKEVIKLEVPRLQALDYTYKFFSRCTPEQLRGTMSALKFKDEPALDWGGPKREFFQIVSQQLFDPLNNMFLPTGPNNTFHPSSCSGANEDHLRYFHFAGRFLAKALIEKTYVNAPLTRAVFKLLLGKSLMFQDCQTVNKDMYLQFRQIMDYTEGELDSLDLNFEINVDYFGARPAILLKENGADENVNIRNVREYIKLYSSYIMVNAVNHQLLAFLHGFYEIVPVQALTIFNEFELEQALCGAKELDIEDWKKHSFGTAIRPKSKQREKWFWEIMEEFDNQKRVQVLQFVTGSAQVPVTFANMMPPFTVSSARGLTDGYLPYGHTCFNKIDLPKYSSKENMRKGIEKALELGLVGFTMR